MLNCTAVDHVEPVPGSIVDASAPREGVPWPRGDRDDEEETVFEEAAP